MIQIKHTLSIQDDGVTISGRITDCIFIEGSERGDRKKTYNNDGFYIASMKFPELFKYDKGLCVWGEREDDDNIIISCTYSSPEEAQKIMVYINEFTIKEETMKNKTPNPNTVIVDGVEYRYVYVSDKSEHQALKYKRKRIFLYEFPGKKEYKYVCVSSYNENKFENGYDYATNNWIYIAEIPLEEEKERKIVCTDTEWQEVQKILKLKK